MNHYNERIEHLPLKNVPFANMIKMKIWQMGRFSVATVPFFNIFGFNFINIPVFPMFNINICSNINNLSEK